MLLTCPNCGKAHSSESAEPFELIRCGCGTLIDPPNIDELGQTGGLQSRLLHAIAIAVLAAVYPTASVIYQGPRDPEYVLYFVGGVAAFGFLGGLLFGEFLFNVIDQVNQAVVTAFSDDKP